MNDHTQEKHFSPGMAASAILSFAPLFQWNRREFAAFFACWFETTPRQLLNWLLLNHPCRKEAEKALAEHILLGDTIYSNTRQGSQRSNKLSRHTNWAKTYAKANLTRPLLCYYNAQEVPRQDIQLNGALKFLALAWYRELMRFRQQASEAENRLSSLKKILSHPRLRTVSPLPFSPVHLRRLAYHGGEVLCNALTTLGQWERKPFNEEDLTGTVNELSARNENHLFELYTLLRSAETLQQLPGWQLSSICLQSGGKIPAIFLECTEKGLQCRISKGGLLELDELKFYRSETAYGFEPDIVFLFTRKEKTGTREGFLFLGDAKNYDQTKSDVAYRDKLLNLFAFSRALGLELGRKNELIHHHRITENGKEIPIPSFLIFFSDPANINRSLRHAMESFAVTCFDCKDCQGCKGCKGNIKDSLGNMIRFIEARESWPLAVKNEKLIWKEEREGTPDI